MWPCDPQPVIFRYSNVNLNHRLKFCHVFWFDFGLPVSNIDFCKYSFPSKNLLTTLKTNLLRISLNFLRNLRQLTSNISIISIPIKMSLKFLKNMTFNYSEVIIVKTLLSPSLTRATAWFSTSRIISDISRFEIILEPIHKVIGTYT